MLTHEIINPDLVHVSKVRKKFKFVVNLVNSPF